MNRSYAREPVSCARAAGPPTAVSSAWHSAVVDESCQLGMMGREKASASCEDKGSEGLREARSLVDVLDQ